MTFQLILDEIKNNLEKILDDLSISDVNFTVEENPGEAVAGLGYSLAKNVPGANYHIVERKYTPTSVIEEAEEVETQMHNFYDKPIREAA